MKITDIEWNKLMRALYPKDRSKVFKKTELQPYICAGCGKNTHHSVINYFNLHICSEECLDVIKMQLIE